MNKPAFLAKTILILINVACNYGLCAQELVWDSTYRPNLYTTRLGQFKSFPDSRADIVFLGNSITAYGNWDELLGNVNIRNRGIPGDITFGVIERLDEITDGRPGRIFILIGINDVARNIPDSVVISNYQRIIHHIKKKSPETKIYFHTLLPVNNSFTPTLPHFNKDQHIANINRGLVDLGKREGIVVIDLFATVLDSGGKLDKKYSFDGLHLNDKGYMKWAAILRNKGFLKK